MTNFLTTLSYNHNRATIPKPAKKIEIFRIKNL